MTIEVISRQELLARAGRPETARRWLRAGVYRRVLYGAYAPGDVEEDVLLRCAALRLVLPDDVALSHWSAL